MGSAWLEWWTLLEDIEEQQRSYFWERERREGDYHRHIDWWSKRWSRIDRVATGLWLGDVDYVQWQRKREERVGETHIRCRVQQLQDYPHLWLQVPDRSFSLIFLIRSCCISIKLCYEFNKFLLQGQISSVCCCILEINFPSLLFAQGSLFPPPSVHLKSKKKKKALLVSEKQRKFNLFKTNLFESVTK